MTPGSSSEGSGSAAGTSFSGRRVCVIGLGVSGRAAARVLCELGARVTILDTRDDAERRELATAAEAGGVAVQLGGDLPEGTELVVTSPGMAPTEPLLVTAAETGVEVIGEVELAWRLREVGSGGVMGRASAPWLAITGTDGKTTVVRMLASILTAAGYKTIAVGNVGTPIVEAVLDGYDVLAVELSSFQLHWSRTVAPYAATVLNLAPDHLDWHGSLEAYAADKAKIFGPGTIAVLNADDPVATGLGAGADPSYGFTLGVPAPGQLGVVEDVLVDRAFTDDPVRTAAELCEFADIRPFAPHNVANALAAAGLARAYGVPPEAVRDGLRAFVPDRHRIEFIATVGGVDYVNDSKATQGHAAAASLGAYESVVWIAGGLLKGLDVDELVRSRAGRLRAAVLLGRDRGRIAEALTRHAPNVPVVEVAETDTGAMDRVVTEAARLARPGDTVLLAPAGASYDMFANYPARGDAFAAAVHRLADAPR